MEGTDNAGANGNQDGAPSVDEINVWNTMLKGAQEDKSQLGQAEAKAKAKAADLNVRNTMLNGAQGDSSSQQQQTATAAEQKAKADELNVWNTMLKGASGGQLTQRQDEASFWRAMSLGAHQEALQSGVPFPEFARRFLDEVERLVVI